MFDLKGTNLALEVSKKCQIIIENIIQNLVLVGAVGDMITHPTVVTATTMNNMDMIRQLIGTKGGATDMMRYNNGGGYNGGYEMRRGGGRRRDSRGRYMQTNGYYEPYPYHDPIYNDPQMRGGMRGNMMNAGHGQGYGMQQMGYGQAMGGYPQEHFDEREMREWVDQMETKDANGNIVKRGEKYTEQQTSDLAKRMNIKFDKFSEKAFWATMNMLYAIFYPVVGDNQDLIARMAKAWLCNDSEELMGDEKLYAYYCYIVCGE